jgi:hypothetical protein
MPGIYKEKQCPTCAIKHRKKGVFCSKICSNKGRGDEYKEKMRNRMLHTEEGQQRSWNLNWDDRDEPVAPQVQRDTPSLARNQFRVGGDIWTIADD